MKKYHLIIIAILICSCQNREKLPIKQYVDISVESGIIVSAKSNFKDTLFYEHRYSDSTKFFYILLTKQQNEELKKLVSNLNAEKKESKFEPSTDDGMYIVESDKIKFYRNDFSKMSDNNRKLYLFYRVTSLKMINVNEIKNFWNINGISPPPNPPKEKTTPTKPISQSKVAELKTQIEPPTQQFQ